MHHPTGSFQSGAMFRILLKVALCMLLIAIAVNSILKRIWTNHGIISEPKAKYDVIIVGAGSAGCVVARRLWEKTDLSILVIESGTTAPWISIVPLLAPALQGYTADWGYKTVSQKYSQYGMKERQSAWPRGKVLGGTSVLNYMLHTWGTRSDFDDVWDDGSLDWNYDTVRHYFKKAESFRRSSGDFVSVMRGRHGPMPVEEFEATSSRLATAFLDGAASLGIEIGDLNGVIEDGAMPAQTNTWKGWRVSTVDAYLDPITEMSNIQLLTSTQVVRVITEKKKATGVVAVNLYSGATYHIRATKQVILSAGVIGSPQLLMVSGIGPRKHLEKLGIPVVLNQPEVGQNLRDHLNVPLYFDLNVPVSITTAKVRSISEVWKYVTQGKGFLASSGVESIARIPVPGDNSTLSKLYFMVFNVGSVNEELFATISNFKNDTFLDTFPDSNNLSKEGFVILASCTHPASKGKLELASANPVVAPLIDPNYLSKREDVTCLTEAVKMAAKLGMTKPLRDLGANLFLPSYKHCSSFHQSLKDDKYLECWIRTAALTAYHPVGTCAMESKSANVVGILDRRLRVRGLKNLRVVDSSVFPHLTSGNPHAAILMIAERAADFVLEDIMNAARRSE
ncbi:glucose dehydrogenase [Nephila pilipes]|uniref:Glucose dehydrogenase n=1 Tax=Nephila pilipes TaxID=299642 RepID=A0A8X6P1I7_NEPPI|nr:glucose dehydrogenase [Nephila pilipes]